MLKNSKLFLFLLSALLLLPLWASAQTEVSNSSITNPVWTPENSPYLVSGTLEVAKGALLRIEAGTEVRFNAGARILVNGELQVKGTEADPVMMTLNTSATNTPAYWSGIEFGPDSIDAVILDNDYARGSIIEGAIIKFSEGIKLNDASPYINNNQFSNNSVGINIIGSTASAGELILDGSSAGSNANKVKPVYVVNNTFSDNTSAIIVNRSNGRDYVITPVGYSYLGDKVNTSYIKNNLISGSNNAIQVLKGDNNIISGNTIRYNTGAAISLATLSRGNLVQNNDLNNNLLGAVLASGESMFLNNNVKNNTDTGLIISAKPLLFSYNNFYNNKKYNLNNSVYLLAAKNNYWGSKDISTIEASFLTASGSGSYPVDYNPFLKTEVASGQIMAPVLDPLESLSNANITYISGIKPAGMKVYVNNKELGADINDLIWSYRANLSLGENTFAIYYKDEEGNKSEIKEVAVQYYDVIAAPTVSSYKKQTSLEKMLVSGTKPSGTSLLLDGQEIKPASEDSSWTYNFDLKMGENSFNLSAYDPISKQTSLVTNFKITRTKDTTAETLAAEKALVKNVDAKLAQRLAGRLLLQVEKGGVVWYVNPEDNKRYLVTMDNALNLFRSLSLGISEANLEKLPTPDSEQKGDAALMKRLAGKLLLRVESAGRISYIDVNGYRHDVSQDNLMDLFRSLSLGISNENIYKIAVGE